MQDAVAGRQWAHLIAAQELAHHGQAVEYFGEHIAVGRTRGCLSVVLGQAQAAALGDEKCIDARGWAGGTEARSMLDQCLLPVEQAELGTEVSILYGGVIGFVEGVQQDSYSRLQEAILFRRYEAWTQDGA